MNKIGAAVALLATQVSALRLKASSEDMCSANVADWPTWLTTTGDHGLTLETPCTTLDPNEDCDCYEEGFYDWDGSDCWSGSCAPERYFSSDEYQAQTRDVKLAEIWTQLTETNHSTGEVSPTKVKCQNFAEMYKHLQQNPEDSYYVAGDEMQNTRTETRHKLVHQQGVVGTGKFVIAEGITDTYGYTGIFESGSDSMLIRFSETGLHIDGVTQQANPSVAFKFLRDGIQSANQFGMVAFDTQDDQGWDFFGKDLLSHLPNFKESSNTSNTCAGNNGDIDRQNIYSSECGPMTGGRWMSQATDFVFANGNYKLAQYRQDDSEEVASPSYPFRLKFVANPDLSTDGNSRFFEQMTNPESPNYLEKDILLYTVQATDGVAEDWFDLGHIYTTSNFSQSLWGDERLFFQHSGLTVDLSGYPTGWRQEQQFSSIREEYSFNSEKYGYWSDPDTFTVPEATENDVINGMVGSGCPFAFMIDAINSLGLRDPDFVVEQTGTFF